MWVAVRCSKVSQCAVEFVCLFYFVFGIFFIILFSFYPFEALVQVAKCALVIWICLLFYFMV
jgi:hypothetical protein